MPRMHTAAPHNKDYPAETSTVLRVRNLRNSYILETKNSDFNKNYSFEKHRRNAGVWGGVFIERVSVTKLKPMFLKLIMIYNI